METKLFVWNLSYETTENDLRSLFVQTGTVIKVDLIKDQALGSSRGIAFVTMSSLEEANLAVGQFDGKNLGSREMKVNITRPTKSNFDSNQPGGYHTNFQNLSGNRH